MLTQVFASAVFGIDAVPITIEVHIDTGIGYHLVGLPDNAVKESNYRIAAALTNTNFKLPGKRITINLAPADFAKSCGAFGHTIKTKDALEQGLKSLFNHDGPGLVEIEADVNLI
jgi:magnesium chelatase family protein